MWPAIIAAGASILGGLLGDRADKKQATAAAQANYDMQKEFATHGIRWKVEDAKKAGVHPLAALGVPGFNPSPSYVGGTGSDYGMRGIGQDISRAISASQTWEEKEFRKVQLEVEKEKLKGLQIQNKKEMESINLPGRTPVLGLPSMDEGDVTNKNSAVIFTPSKVPASQSPGVQEGTYPLYKQYTDDRGRTKNIFQEDVGDALDSDLFAQGQFVAENIFDRAENLLHYKVYHTRAAALHREKLREHRPAVEHPWEEQRYNPYTKSWIRVDTRKTHDSMFYWIPSWLPRWLVPQKNIPY